MRPPRARSEPDPRAPVTLPLLLHSLMTLDDPKVEVMMPDVTNQADKARSAAAAVGAAVQLLLRQKKRKKERKGEKRGRRRKKRADLEKKRPTVLEIIDSDQSADVYNTCILCRHVD